MTEAEKAAAEEKRWKRVWRHPLVVLVVAIVVLIAVSVALSAFFRFAVPAEWSDAAGGALPTLVQVVVLWLLYKLMLRKLGERRHDDLPVNGRAAKELAIGVGAGVALIALAAGIAAVFGVYRIVGWGGSTDLLMILFQMGIGAAFVEEVLVRGVLFRWLEEFGGSWAALALTALLFGLGHAGNPNATAFTTVAIAFEAGILLGAAYMYTRSLWLAIGMHFGWNVTQGYLFDVPVSGHDVDGLVQARFSGPELLSGGEFGLEGSVIAFVVCTAAGVWLVLHAIRKGRLMAPRSRRVHRVD
jgi:membrane protease YdiL (CAAX protease family)